MAISKRQRYVIFRGRYDSPIWLDPLAWLVLVALAGAISFIQLRFVAKRELQPV